MLLVTSAGGKTGQAIVKAFSQAGLPVRAMIRSKIDTSKLTEIGAKEVYFGDLINASDVLGAMEGCDAVYFICPNMNKHETQFGANIIDAACSLNVNRLIFHSVLHTQVQDLEHHWNRLFVEEAIVESGIPYSILQVGSYYQNMLPGWEKMIKTGVHAMPYKIDVPMSLVDLDEVAEAAVNVLKDPQYEYTYGKPNWFDFSKAEHEATRNNVGLFEQSSFGKFVVSGPDSESFLNHHFSFYSHLFSQ